MRLDFNTLWVEDQPNAVRAQSEAIARRLADLGFEFCPRIFRTLGEVREFVSEDVFVDEVDLVLVDWDLGNGPSGEKAISEIRAQVQYKDVIFYSALNDVGRLRKLAFDQGLEGVYCATRNDLVDEVLGVSESLVKKVLDLDHTRGIVMGATSDIDQMASECLIALHANLEPGKRAKLIEGALKRIEQRLGTINKKVAEIRQNPSIELVLKQHMVFTSYDKHDTLSQILNGEEFAKFHSYREHITTYREEVLKDRNRLGHQVLSPEGKPIAISAPDGQQVNLEQMRALRKRLLLLRAEFRALHSILVPRP